MSKIAFVMPPAYGHLNPALPVMKELSRRAVQVVCYNTEEFRPPIEQSGAAFRSYPATDLSPEAFSHVLQDGNLAGATGLLLRSTEEILPGLLEDLGREKPDLLVFDSIAVWGKMAAAQLGIPAAASIGHLVMDERHIQPGDMLRMLGQYLPKVPGILQTRRRLMQRYPRAYPRARPLFPMRDRLNIVFTSRELQPDTPLIDDSFRFVGPSIDPQTRGGDFPFEALVRKPVVYISLGTVHAGQVDFFRACFAAFGDFPGQFVLSIGRTVAPEELGPLPANFIVRATVPQLELLPHTDVFITHGGINSVHEGLYYGVPLIMIPQQQEQLLNARCVARLGAGRVLDGRVRGRAIEAGVLRGELERVLGSTAYSQAAGVQGETLRALGGYREAADILQEDLGRTSTSS